MVLIVQASPDLQKEQLQEILVEGMKQSNCTCEGGRPSIKDVNPSFFRQFDAIYRELDDANEQVVVAPSGGGVLVLPSQQSSRWEVRLTSPKKFLKSLTLTYANDKKETLTPEQNKNRLRKLGLTESGGDIYDFQTSERPVKYSLLTGELGKEDETLTGEWPRLDNFYVISFRNFQGDFARMQEVLSDSEKVSDPLKRIQDVSDMRFLFANFGDTTPIGAGPISNNRYELRVETLPGRKVARVWVYFPLTPELAKSALPTLRDLKTGRQVSEHIRSTETVAADTEITFSADMKPMWIELPAANGGFVRSFKLGDLAELKAKFPKLFYFVAWEFQADNGDPSAIPSAPRAGVRRAFVSDFEESRWLFDLVKEIERQKPPVTQP